MSVLITKALRVTVNQAQWRHLCHHSIYLLKKQITRILVIALFLEEIYRSLVDETSANYLRVRGLSGR